MGKIVSQIRTTVRTFRVYNFLEILKTPIKISPRHLERSQIKFSPLPLGEGLGERDIFCRYKSLLSLWKRANYQINKISWTPTAISPLPLAEGLGRGTYFADKILPAPFGREPIVR